MTTPMLHRSRDDRMLAGVCGGLAAHLGLPVLVVRVGMAVLTLFGGAGALFYLWLWATAPREGETAGIVPMRSALTRAAEGQSPDTSIAASQIPLPDAPDPEPSSQIETRRVRSWPVAELLLGVSLLIAGAALVLDRLGVSLRLEVILPGMAVLVGVGLTWWQIADRERPERHQLPRVLGALALVAVGVLMFFVTAKQPDLWTVVAAALAVLAGIALALAPWLLRLNRELIAERAAREREAERAEIAAHLHDSVLQTLALIQQRADPGSEVDRLARGQERELREWLFRAADGGEASHRELEAELRVHAGELEETHAVRFELVVVGGGADRVVPEALAAAAREAMLNAARHAGGTVTVYIEIARDRASVDVTDRGPGFDADDLPEGRMGVRESIRGRMDRAGGTARIGSGPGGAGTAVRLSVPLVEIGEFEVSADEVAVGGAAVPDAPRERNEEHR
ncbi:ATP-binding protein [Leucobacter sp. GX24907]